MKLAIVALSVLMLLSGCGSAKIITAVSSSDVTPGKNGWVEYYPLVPAMSVEITTRSLGSLPLYFNDAGKDKFTKRFCVSTQKSKEVMIPSRRPRYINIKMPSIGKGSGQIVLNSKGGLQSVSINSDTTALPKAAIDAVSSALPYAALLKGLEAITDKLSVLDVPTDITDAALGLLTGQLNGQKLFMDIPLTVIPQSKEAQLAAKQLAIDIGLTFSELQDKYCRVNHVIKSYERFDGS